MSEHVGGNGVYVGSFNPPHEGHIQGMRDALEVFDTLHVFVRYNEGVDLTDRGRAPMLLTCTQQLRGCSLFGQKGQAPMAKQPLCR